MTIWFFVQICVQKDAMKFNTKVGETKWHMSCHFAIRLHCCRLYRLIDEMNRSLAQVWHYICFPHFLSFCHTINNLLFCTHLWSFASKLSFTWWLFADIQTSNLLFFMVHIFFNLRISSSQLINFSALSNKISVFQSKKAVVRVILGFRLKFTLLFS